MENQIFICECCGKQHDGMYGSGRFCSKRCSCSRKFSEKSKKKISDSIKQSSIKKFGGNFCVCGQIFTRKSLLKHQKECQSYLEYKKKFNINSEFTSGNCQYCGKFCKNKNSLNQHEIRCKQNPNKIKINAKGWTKGKKREKSSTKGKIWITNGISNKVVFPEIFEKDYKLNGWIIGINKKFISKTTGRALTPEKEEMRKKKISETMRKNKKSGGYRINSGKGKQGWYKGIFCDSSWELAFLYYYLEHNLKIERCKEIRKYIINGEEHKYIPDFVTDQGIIEIKGYMSEKSKQKSFQNPDIKILMYDDIKFYLDFVIKRFGKNFYEKLYE